MLSSSGFKQLTRISVREVFLMDIVAEVTIRKNEIMEGLVRG